MTEEIFEQDERQTARLVKARKRMRSEEVADMRWLLSDKRGQRFLRRLFAECGILSVSYVSNDALATSFNEGKKSIGLKFLKDVQELNKVAFSVVLNEKIDMEKALQDVRDFTNENDEVESE